MHDTNLTNQGKTTSAHYLIKEVSECCLELSDLLYAYNR